MFASRLISESVPPLKPGDTFGRALKWMEELRVNVLPVINGKKYLGLITKNTVSDPALADKTIESQQPTLNRVFVFGNQHVYDLVKLASLERIDIVPVLNEKEEYEGIVTVNDLVQYFAEIKSVYTPGGIIILEIALKDYSMSQIAQLIEAEGAHILSAGVAPTDDSKVIELTLKIDKVDLSRILAALYRYNYKVIASYHQSEHAEDLKNRFDEFMNYLNIG
jgi:acetoin utilization protein AcuB